VLIIGERINSTRKFIREAVLRKDAEFIKTEANRQLQAGAHMLDVNGGVPGQETELLSWLVNVVQDACDAPLCLDSADPEALQKALPLCKRPPMINSITDEPARFRALLPVIKEHRTKVVALCIAESGPPSGLEDRVDIASRLVDRLTGEGIALADIYVDPCVFPIGTGSRNGLNVLEAVTRIRTRDPGVHTSCGVSNVSFGLPVRKLLNEVFLIMLMSRGMDAAIIDPCDEGVIARLTAAETLRGQDADCMAYIKAYRKGILETQSRR
jgi:5-methyltetrahydrofolate corrinoid/iron sulfur protein methyltransferase